MRFDIACEMKKWLKMCNMRYQDRGKRMNFKHIHIDIDIDTLTSAHIHARARVPTCERKKGNLCTHARTHTDIDERKEFLCMISCNAPHKQTTPSSWHLFETNENAFAFFQKKFAVFLLFKGKANFHKRTFNSFWKPNHIINYMICLILYSNGWEWWTKWKSFASDKTRYLNFLWRFDCFVRH